METFDRLQYQIALVAPRRQDYDTTALFLQDKCSEYAFKTSRALCTRGRIGPHHFVLAGDSGDNSDIALFVHDTTNDLLTEFPCIRIGFLIGVDAIAPADGIAKIGDIVVGIPQGLEPGLVQFDAHETSLLGRLSVTHQMSHPPSAVQSIGDSLRAESGQQEFQEELLNKAMIISNTATEQENLSWSKPLKVQHGKIASSQDYLPEDAVLNKVGRDGKILCFERSAARLTPQLPFLTICGVTKAAGISGTSLEERRAGIAAVVYAILITSKIGPSQLETEHHFANLYSYKPLELERPGFRLVRLERGGGFPLRCSLFQAYLDDEESIVPYEGLSYVWGGHDMPDKITIDGKTISVTKSLHDALLQLRQLDQDRILWVDALCIDQSNIKERSHQVNHMGEIYRKADNVIIWLGHLGSDADFLREAIDYFAKQLPPEAFRRWSHEDPRWLDHWHQFQSVLGFADNVRLINGLNDFMQSSWFRRVWILQEVANAKRAIIETNLGKIHAKLFAILPHMIGSPVSEQCQSVLDIMPGPSRKTSWWSQDRNLCTLLCKFKGSEASDPRDRVYALLGMASDMGSKAIEADYAKEEKIVIRDLCAYIYDTTSPIGFSITSIRQFQSQLPTISTQVLLNKLRQRITTGSLLLYLGRQGTLGDVNNTWRSGHHLRIYQEKKCQEILPVDVEFAPGSHDILGHLLRRKHAPPILMRDVLSWMVNMRYYGLETFVHSVREDIEARPELAIDLIGSHPADHMNSLRLIFHAFRNRFKLDETTIMRAIHSDEATLRLLLYHCEHPITLSNRFLVKIISAGNAASYNPRALELLLISCPSKIELESDLFLHAASKGQATLRVLFRHCIRPINVTKEMLESAMKADIFLLRLIFENWVSYTETTEFVTCQAALAGVQVLKYLINTSKSKIQVTDNILHILGGSRVLKSHQMLLELRKSETDVTEEEAIRAIESGFEPFLELFNRPGTNFRLTEKICKVALKHDVVFRVLEKRRPSELFSFKRELFFQGSASLESATDRELEKRGLLGWEHISELIKMQKSYKRRRHN